MKSIGWFVSVLDQDIHQNFESNFDCRVQKFDWKHSDEQKKNKKAFEFMRCV